MRASSVSYLTFWLSSFWFSWPFEYGGLPITTMIGWAFCLFARSLLPSSTSMPSSLAAPPSASWKVSTRTMPSNGSVFAGVRSRFGVCRFDVDGSDVVGEQDDLVGVQLCGVLAGEVFGLDEAGLEQPYGEGPGPNEGVDDVDTLVAQRSAKVPVHSLLGGAENEVDDLDRGVDDAECVGGFRQGGLEELVVQLDDDLLACQRGCRYPPRALAPIHRSPGGSCSRSRVPDRRVR